MKILIMCGGQGKRLGHLTESVPKPLIRLHGKSMLQIKLEEYCRQGFREFIFCIGYKGNMIKEEISGLNLPITAEFSDSGENAGILQRLYDARTLFDDAVVMTYGDTFTNLELEQLIKCHRESAHYATIVTAPIKSPFGLVEVDENASVTYFREKPILNYYIGYAVVRKDALDSLPPDIVAMHDGEGLVSFYQLLMTSKRLGAFNHSGLQITFNTPSELKTAEEALYHFYTNAEMNYE